MPNIAKLFLLLCLQTSSYVSFSLGRDLSAFSDATSLCVSKANEVLHINLLGPIQPPEKAIKRPYLGDHWRVRTQHQWHFGEMKANAAGLPEALIRVTACGQWGFSGSARWGTTPAPPLLVCGWTPGREKETMISVSLVKQLFTKYVLFSRLASTAFSDGKETELKSQRNLLKLRKQVLCPSARICNDWWVLAPLSIDGLCS